MKQKLWDWLKQHTSSVAYVETIYVRESKEKTLQKLWQQRCRIIGIMLGVLVVTIVLCATQESGQMPLTEGRFLKRQDCEDTISVTVKGRQDKETWEKEVVLPIDSRELDAKEMDALDQKVASYLAKTLPGKNQSLQQVNTALVLSDIIPETEVEVRWTVDDTYMQESGQIRSEQIPADGIDTEVVAETSWKNWKKTYPFQIHIQPVKSTPREQWSRQVKKTLQEELKKQSTKERVELPGQIGQVRVTYDMEKEKKSYVPVYAVLGCLLLLPLVWREQQRKKLREREEQLLLDHSGVIHKFMLLLGAGLTVRSVVERLVSEYEEQQKKGGKKRYVYEEMCILLQEIRDGMSERKAVERFGRRCRLLPYLRFCSVLTQNMKKGAEGILAILETESMEALELRKQRALQLGEKAGTKLLFPMVLMLGIVMGMIMVPAFLTM